MVLDEYFGSEKILSQPRCESTRIELQYPLLCLAAADAGMNFTPWTCSRNLT